MSIGTKMRGLATLIVAAVVVLGMNAIMADDDEMDRRAVHFAANWRGGAVGSIEYGATRARQFAKGKSPWDDDMLARPGDTVRLHVQFHSMTGPELLMCWITVNNEVHSSRDPDQHHPSNNGECKVEVVVR